MVCGSCRRISSAASFWRLSPAVIVVGFGLFGIRDIFTNFRANQLATIGDAEISVQEYRNEYQNELQRLQRQARRAITNEEARQMGLDRQVLARARDRRRARPGGAALGLAHFRRGHRQDRSRPTRPSPAHAGFDQARMDEILRDNGYTEASLLREQRQLVLRKQIGAALTGGLKTPEVLLAADQYLHQPDPQGGLFHPAAARPLHGAAARRRGGDSPGTTCTRTSIAARNIARSTCWS